MRLARVAVGDVIKARIKGRSLWGEVTEVKDGIVYFSPISPAAGWRHASAREIIGHWRKSGRRAGGDDDDAPASVSREQLSLPGGAQVTGRDATSTRDSSLEASHAAVSGRRRRPAARLGFMRCWQASSRQALRAREVPR